MKKVFLTMCSVFLFSLCFTSASFASESLPSPIVEKDISQLSDEELSTVAEKLEIDVEELKDLENIVDEGIEKLDSSLEEDSVQISDNLILESEVSEEAVLVPNYLATSVSEDNAVSARAVYSRTVTSTLSLKNILGKTVVTLKSVGVFTTNGKTSTPTDAYGSYTGALWKLGSKKSVKGSKAYEANVRTAFTGELNVGIDPVHVTIQSFKKSGTVYCNAVGKYRSVWI